MATEVQQVRPKEKRDRRSIELVASNMGLKIHAGESNKFPQKVTYEEIIEGVKRGRYKITYTDKRTETEILALLEKQKIKLSNEDFKVVPDDIFRKIRQGKELAPPSKQKKTMAEIVNTLNILQHNVLSWSGRRLELSNI